MHLWWSLAYFELILNLDCFPVAKKHWWFQACQAMFEDLGFVNRWRLKSDTLARWVFLVQMSAHMVFPTHKNSSKDYNLCDVYLLDFKMACSIMKNGNALCSVIQNGEEEKQLLMQWHLRRRKKNCLTVFLRTKWCGLCTVRKDKKGHCPLIRRGWGMEGEGLTALFFLECITLLLEMRRKCCTLFKAIVKLVQK